MITHVLEQIIVTNILPNRKYNTYYVIRLQFFITIKASEIFVKVAAKRARYIFLNCIYKRAFKIVQQLQFLLVQSNFHPK